MKIKKIFLVSFVLFLSFGKTAEAANSQVRQTIESRQETGKVIREEIQEDRQEAKEVRQEARATITTQRKTMWTEMKRKQVQLITGRIQKELEMRHAIVLRLKAKIQERITVKSETHNMSEASAKMAQFSDIQYQAEMTALKTKMAEITASETPRDLLPGVRESANRVRTQIRAMHQFLVEVMKLVATAPEKS